MASLRAVGKVRRIKLACLPPLEAAIMELYQSYWASEIDPGSLRKPGLVIVFYNPIKQTHNSDKKKKEIYSMRSH